MISLLSVDDQEGVYKAIEMDHLRSGPDLLTSSGRSKVHSNDLPKKESAKIPSVNGNIKIVNINPTTLVP